MLPAALVSSTLSAWLLTRCGMVCRSKLTSHSYPRWRCYPGVKALYPVDTIAMPIPFEEVSTPELFTALAQTGADIAQNELGFTGAGIKVAVMDTGLDYDHPAFSGMAADWTA